MLVKYFERDGEEWEVKPDLRARCEFREEDVCVPFAGTQQFDLVLMRNVLLFLSAQDRSAAFASVYRRMVPDGVLVLGHAEQAEDSTNLFEVEFGANCYFYRPVNASEPFSSGLESNPALRRRTSIL